MTPPTDALQYVLLPGRHHLLTRFQARYLRALVHGELTDIDGVPLEFGAPPVIVFAVTSANHHGTRRNPIPYDRREAAIERFSMTEGLAPLVAPIFDAMPTARFADVTLKAVTDATSGAVAHTTSNTVIACSTPDVIALYRSLGFRIAPVELDHPEQPARPWDVLELLARGDPSWTALAHEATREVFERYGLDTLVRDVCNDPVLGSDGSLTDTRNYRTYMASFENAAERKWKQARPYVRPGRIVDVGCATGAMLELAAADPELWESDLYGVEIARHLYGECVHKKSQGVFANPNTFFVQRNMMAGAAFAARSVDTTLTFALTHEIYSYGGGRTALERFTDVIFEQTAPEGVWINSDVCGPDDPEREVRLALTADDGSNPEAPIDLAALEGGGREHLARLSTRARFEQFARDFRAFTGVPFAYTVTADGSFRLRLADAMEFLAKKDYLDNWLSECHEQFCFLSWDGWCELVRARGFEIDPRSGAWRNDWLVANRFQPVAQLFDPAGEPVEWPVTHLLLVARRPQHA